jgi:hypothetical protein
MNSVLTGESSGSGTQQAEAQFGGIVAKVIQAAYDAVHSGVSISLLVAGCVILVSGLIAWLTFSVKGMQLEQ